MKTAFTICLLLLVNCLLWGQNTIGLPDIVNYHKQTYKAGTQNWDIAQDKNNLLYFANNEGIVSFDGAYWKTYPVPNKTITRSVAVDAKNTIYVGAQNEFGYFEAGKNGQLTYKSLKPLIPEKTGPFPTCGILPVITTAFFSGLPKPFLNCGIIILMFIPPLFGCI